MDVRVLLMVALLLGAAPAPNDDPEAEAAAQLGVQRGTVKSRLHRARRKLEKALERSGR